MIYSIIVPDDCINELVYARNCDPDHVQGSARVPRMKMPRQRDQDEEEPKYEDDGKRRKSWIHACCR